MSSRPDPVDSVSLENLSPRRRAGGFMSVNRLGVAPPSIQHWPSYRSGCRLLPLDIGTRIARHGSPSPRVRELRTLSVLDRVQVGSTCTVVRALGGTQRRKVPAFQRRQPQFLEQPVE